MLRGIQIKRRGGGGPLIMLRGIKNSLPLTDQIYPRA